MSHEKTVRGKNAGKMYDTDLYHVFVLTTI